MGLMPTTRLMVTKALKRCSSESVYDVDAIAPGHPDTEARAGGRTPGHPDTEAQAGV